MGTSSSTSNIGEVTHTHTSYLYLRMHVLAVMRTAIYAALLVLEVLQKKLRYRSNARRRYTVHRLEGRKTGELQVAGGRKKKQELRVR